SRIPRRSARGRKPADANPDMSPLKRSCERRPQGLMTRQRLRARAAQSRTLQHAKSVDGSGRWWASAWRAQLLYQAPLILSPAPASVNGSKPYLRPFRLRSITTISPPPGPPRPCRGFTNDFPSWIGLDHVSHSGGLSGGL